VANIDLHPVSQPPVAGSSPVGAKAPLGEPAKNGLADPAFGRLLTEMLSATNDLQIQADQQSRALLSGESRNVHETMIALEKANISFRFLNQVRNKAIEAYREITRMQM